jgi:hypothetical protein
VIGAQYAPDEVPDARRLACVLVSISGRVVVSGPRRAERERLAGMAMAVVFVVMLTALMAGWVWIAAPAVLGILGLAASAVGADSRRAGDWRRVETT